LKFSLNIRELFHDMLSQVGAYVIGCGPAKELLPQLVQLCPEAGLLSLQAV
jgi:hypothetical protein